MKPADIPVTVIIPVKNEEKNIEECLASVRWADEIFVVDSHSTDRTREIAERAGATVVDFEYHGGWPKKKNWAIRSLPIRNDWILILDADERVGPELRDEIAAAITRPAFAGYYVRWKFMFLGRWMRHSWRHGWMLRLFRKGLGEYEDLGMRSEGGWDNEVHENMVVNGPTGFLSNWLIHDSNQSLSYWIAKQNDFSDWNAALRSRQVGYRLPRLAELVSGDPVVRRRAMKRLYLAVSFKPLLMFFYLYVIRLGMLDGKEGLYFCLLRVTHELNTEVKRFERENRVGVSG
jgi:glycosyltransferase involved in cell wall biosynthesis